MGYSERSFLGNSRLLNVCQYQTASQPGISRDELLVDLWSGKDLDFDTWSVQAKNKLDLYEEGFNPESSISAEWSLDESWLFACTIFTTIGKGI